MAAAGIIETTHLFEELQARLIELLTSLDDDEWRRPTIVPGWNVQHIAAHLLDTSLRRLAMCRDGWFVSQPPIETERDLVALVNGLNAQGVAVYGRLSPSLLIAWTRQSGAELTAYFRTLDPVAPAPWAVSWAGEVTSPNWFDIAREYTERWHHQQQIRLALGRPDILNRRLYFPVLDTFMRSVPRAYKSVAAAIGTACELTVPGETGGSWYVVRREEGWRLEDGPVAEPVSRTIIPPDVAWRLFTNSLPAPAVRERVSISGDAHLGAVVCAARAIVT